eukprot:10137021-Alexandrium_andersonii.AAC.1
MLRAGSGVGRLSPGAMSCGAVRQRFAPTEAPAIRAMPEFAGRPGRWPAWIPPARSSVRGAARS